MSMAQLAASRLLLNAVKVWGLAWGRASLLVTRKLLVAPGITTSNKKLLATKDIATSSSAQRGTSSTWPWRPSICPPWWWNNAGQWRQWCQCRVTLALLNSKAGSLWWTHWLDRKSMKELWFLFVWHCGISLSACKGMCLKQCVESRFLKEWCSQPGFRVCSFSWWVGLLAPYTISTTGTRRWKEKLMSLSCIECACRVMKLRLVLWNLLHKKCPQFVAWAATA